MDENKQFKSMTDAIEALRAVVAGREDHVYPGARFGTCFNFAVGKDGRGCPTREIDESDTLFDEDGTFQPSCVVGHVLARWGLPKDLWGTVEGGIESTRFNLRNSSSPFVIDDNAALVLRAAQVSQDSGKTWGASLANAETVYADLVSGIKVTNEIVDARYA